ncbi:MAG: hypothetical protein JWO22_1908 [Frankiales bacterium]|nr:hypothetical protein [Frankiales bacterium]
MRPQPLLLVLLLAAACGGSSSSSSAPTAPAVIQPPASEDPGTPSPTASAALPVVDGSGSRFTAPNDPTVKQRQNGPPGDHCYGLADADFTTQSCQAFASKLGKAIAVVETRGPEERDLVWTVTDSRASLALRAVRTASSSNGTGKQPGVTARVSIVDLAEDTTPKAVFLTPKGSGYDAIASVDVVEASGMVVIHRDLNGGKAGRAAGGGLQTVVPTGGDKAVESVIQFVNGAWRVTTRKSTTTAAAVEGF